MKIRATVRTWRESGDGDVMCYICIDRGRVWFKTNCTVSRTEWENSTESFLIETPETQSKQLLIDKIKSKINNVLIIYQLSGTPLDAKKIKREVEGISSPDSFFDFAYYELYENRTKILAPGTWRHNKSVLFKFQEFRTKLRFRDIDSHLMNDFRQYLKKRGNNPRTIQKAIETLSIYINLAVRQKRIMDDPLLGYKRYRLDPAERNFLTPHEVKKVLKYFRGDECPECHRRVLRVFLWACFTGQRISDVRKVSWEMICGNVLTYSPQKSASSMRLCKIPLADGVWELLGQKKNKGLIFDFQADQVVNRELKDIFRFLGIDKKITFHCSRHTFATLYLRQTHNMAALKSMLGHANIRETNIYTHILEDDIRVDMAKMNGLFR